MNKLNQTQNQENRDTDHLSSPSTDSSEVVVGDVGKKNFFKNKKVIIGLLVVSLLGLAYLGFLNFYKTSEKQVFKDIVIGDTTITKADIDRYVRSIENYKKENPDLKFDQSPIEIAIDDLVMNAALVKEAKDRNKSLTEAELRKIYNIPKTTEDYQATVESWKSYDGSGYFIYTVDENLQLRKKLTADLLAKKSIFHTAVNFDAPFFSLEKDSDKLKTYHDQAKQRLEKELLPLFQQKLTKDEIAKKADVNYVDSQKEPDDIYKLFIKKVVTTAGYMENYSSSYVSNPKYNDIATMQKSGKLNESFYDLKNVDYGILIEDLKNTNEEIAKLKNVGDHTGVFASKTGRYMIARLEKKSGGDYSTWEEFLNQYKEASIPKENKISKSLQSQDKKSPNLLSQLVTPQTAKAQSGVPGGCGAHVIQASIALVFPTGASSDALVAIRQSSNVCLPGGAAAWGNGYASITGTCWGSPPSSSYDLPSGYSVTADLTSTWAPSDTNTYHVWQRYVYLDRQYNPPPPNNNPGNPGNPGGNNPVEPTCSVNASVSRDPNTLQYSVTISWSSDHNQSQSLSWGGSGKSGTTVINNVTSFPQTYTGTFTNNNFSPPRSVTCSDTVNVPGGPTDVCPNIDGIQDRVPDGYVLDSNGNCVQLQPLSPTVSPYMRVYGNDVIVGSVFGEKDENGELQCNNDNYSSGIKSVTASVIIDGKRVHTGSSGQLGVFDYTPGVVGGRENDDPGVIEGFFSDNLRSKEIPKPGGNFSNSSKPNNLTFGNHYSLFQKLNAGRLESSQYPGWYERANTRVKSWGGDSGILMCIPDYYNDVKDAGADEVSGGTLSNIAPSYTEPIKNGERKLLVVDGDLFIDKNVEYQNTEWANVSQIPNVTVVVKGNIRVDKDVTRLDGIFVAQPTRQNRNNNPRDGGLFYTCAQSSAPYRVSELLQNCNKQLVVNGSIIAKNVIFHRTKGSLTCDPKLPAELECTPAQPNEGADSDNIAEVINFSPEAYLTPLNSRLETSAPYQKYDYIKSLPPVL